MRLNLRDIILNIKVQEVNSPLRGTYLFHAVDFVGDTAKLWIDNQLGPGGACFVFSYYKQNQGEAIQMIRGLGRYVAKV